MIKGQNEMWRSVKRMRIGMVDSGNEGEDYWEEGYVGTRFENLGDVEEERRRKLVTGDPFEESDFIADMEKNEKTLSTEIQASRIDAVFDGNASPRSSKRTRIKHTSAVAGVDEAAVEDRKKPREEQGHQHAHGGSTPAEMQVLVESVGKTASSVEEVAQETRKNAPLTDGDDTEYLHAFLTRARAKKAARSILSPERQLSKAQQKTIASSPQTRSRTALATLDGNSPSPTKMRKVDLPPRKLEQDDTVSSNMQATSPLRKSTRTRLPRPQRHQPATPNNIPFRRSNGTEFVFLRKTEAQQIALATRSNTRRNKGEAVQPKMKLVALSSTPQSSPEKVPRKRKKDKRVSWDKALAYFAPEEVQPMEEAKEQTEPKTPVKRSRRLAPGKGTPAPKKKMAEAAMDVATPLARTRTRTKDKT